MIETSGYTPARQAPKIKFQAAAGYSQQREAFPAQGIKTKIEITMATQAEYNMWTGWIESVKSDAFWFICPESLVPRPDGQIIPRACYGRITDDEIPEAPRFPSTGGFTWKFSFTFQSIGGVWEG